MCLIVCYFENVAIEVASLSILTCAIYSCFKADASVYYLYLTHHQTTNFRLFQTERVRRRQFQICRKWQQVIQTGRKHRGKRRNCLSQAISPFPTVVSKGLCPRGLRRCHCVGMV